jgi:uncharacterized protein (TIGR02271 family)
MARPEETRELERARREQRPVRSAEGDEIGRVDALYYDLEQGGVAWIGVADTATGVRTLVPAAGVSFGHDAVRVPYEREVVARAPQVDAEELDGPTEELLTAYFGVGESVDEHETAVLGPDEQPATAPSEQTVVIGKQREEAGRVRLRKRVVTEPVTVEVELQHETAHVVREPLGLPVADDVELTETEIEIPLFAERPVLGKYVVAAERIRIETNVARETETVEDEVRVERTAEDDA